jgi:hypothetical protein
MRIKDNYNAKYDIWAEKPVVVNFPQMILPFKFSAKKFKSYKEMNDWKKELIARIAESGGVKWKS